MHRRIRSTNRHRRRAVAAVFFIVTLPVLLGMTVLCVDMGHMYNVQAKLQITADALSERGRD